MKEEEKEGLKKKEEGREEGRKRGRENTEGYTWDFRITSFSVKDIKGFLFTLDEIVNHVKLSEANQPLNPDELPL